jgi:lipoprotein-anchoring transpeptidase ErfK/SrfK
LSLKASRRFGGRDSHAGWAARPPTLSRLLLVTVLGLLVGLSGGAVGTASIVRRTQELVTLLGPHAVLSAPDARARSLGSIEAQRPITGSQTVLPVIGRSGRGWVHVMLPGRPNGRTGWISARATTSSATGWHIVVDTSRRQVLVFRAGRLVRVFEAIVGKPSTPTPRGEFFVEEAVRLPPGDVGSPFALALSARSQVFQEFDGGPGQIALHGLANIGGKLGTAATHGCVRLDAGAMRWLVGRIGAGVPVTITSHAASRRRGP